MTHSTHGYAINTTGDLVFRVESPRMSTSTTPLHTDASIALFYDAEDGTLYKHGEATSVQAFADTQRAKLAAHPEMTASLRTLTIPVVLMHEAAIRDLVNATLDTTGRVLRLQEDLAQAVAQMDPQARARAAALLAIPA